MRSWLWKGMLGAAVALPALSGAARAQDAGCSNATLTGEYAFGGTAYTPPGFPMGPPLVFEGIKVFDGNGNLTQRDYRGDSLRTLGADDFAPPGRETGTYTVFPDCTGKMTIDLNVPNVPPGLSSGVLEIRFVISNGGRHIHEVVAEFTPPFFASPQPTQTSADDWKVESAQNAQ